MKTRHLIVLSILAGGGTGPAIFAQALTPPLTDPAATAAANPEPSIQTAPTAPRAQRAVSGEVASSISAGMPKYNPPPAEPKSDEELPDLRDTDKPKNQIIRLPKYIVREPRNPVLRERDINTKAGLTALAERRYITDADRALNRWNIFGVRSTGSTGNSTTDRALMMYAEEERLQNMAELDDDAALASATDKAAGAYIKREAQRTYMRTDEFGGRSHSERTKGR